MYITKSTVKKMLKGAGATRVSESALSYFQEQLEKIALKAASNSVKLSRHAKRKTVEESDVKLSFQ
ncbi:MAG: NFYB/HAP3 family transcription factor subunit [Candidatus Marsarchaeota archaeon]|jgi:histone H3/H4|nr:NFYB/HAP3 family transcription factor subunit [Candidatus Marsarchaeota archaeon]